MRSVSDQHTLMRSFFMLALTIVMMTAAVEAHSHQHHTNLLHRRSHSHPHVSVPTATVLQVSFQGGDLECSQPSSPPLQNQPTGVCQPFWNASLQFFCDQDAVYQVIYNDANCQEIQLVYRYSLQCNPYESPINRWQCENSDLGPKIPFDWPIQGMAIGTSCLNQDGEVCAPTDADAVCTDTAFQPNQCHQIYTEAGPANQSVINFCTTDGQYTGVAYYSGINCSGPILDVTLQTTRCNSTESNTMCAGVQLEGPFPLQGLAQFSDSQCATVPDLISFQQPTCENGVMFVCGDGADSEVMTEMQFFDQQCTQFKANTTLPLHQCSQQQLLFCNGFAQ